ncbi:MAG TPA: DUF4160 domain-containing protein [Gammaproteobacteria bacterium]|nr:DUF4160 domain-containing protein [Gammaproteobacteria bacterium]
MATKKQLEGSLKPNKLKLVEAWIEIHRDEFISCIFALYLF